MKKACIPVLALLLLFSCACAKQTPYHEKTGFAMGSVVQLRLYGAENPEETAQNVLKNISDTDAMLSANLENAEIYKLNNTATGMAVSEELFDILGDCLSVCNTTGKVLDITVGAVSELWGFDTDAPRFPDGEQLQRALQTVGMEQLLLDEELHTVAKQEGQKIDLGAFGKGIACMRALSELRGELAPAVLSIGGTVLLYGNHPDADHWTIGIRDPYGTANDYAATLSLTVADSDDTLVVSTSGKYEKTVSHGGKDYHHILDKTTGMPVENGLLSVTVVAEGGLVSDALSTVLFLLGLSEKSLSVLESYGVQAVFLCEDGRMLVTDGLADSLRVTQDTWRVGSLTEAIGGAA